jgi:hypothetical protein
MEKENKPKRKLKPIVLNLLSIVLTAALLAGAACLAPYGRYKAKNTEILETEEFVPPPDSIAYIKSGIAIKLSDTKRDQIYRMFQEAFAEPSTRYSEYFGPIDRFDIIRCVTLNHNIEFRYDQRRKANGVTYDAVLFSFDLGFRLIPIFCRNGQYLDNTMYRTIDFKIPYFAGFHSKVKAAVFLPGFIVKHF